MSTSNIWNEISDTWNSTTISWNIIIDSYSYKGGGFDYDYLDRLYKDRKKLELKEDFIKIFVTIHNEFLTEDQKSILKIVNVYPTYQERFKIKKQEQIVLKEYKLTHKEDLQKTISVSDIKIGLSKIENYVSNKLKK